MSLADRVVGSCLGLALGDALGAPFEFMRAHLIPDPVPAGELDPEDLVRRQVEWFRSDPPDVSTLTRLVLRRAARGENASTAAREIWERRGPEVSAGNGSVMYCAPLGVAHANRPDELFELAPALSALTHFDGRCKTAALAVTFCVAALVRGEDSEVASTSALRSVAEHEGGEELEFLVDAVGDSRPVDGPDQGFCLFTVGVAFQALLRESDVETELRRVVSLGGDTDTNAAVAGALLGARYGFNGLPSQWLDRLIERDAIRRDAEALVVLAERRSGQPSGGSD